MSDYKSMYFKLSAEVANAIDLLIKAQQHGEESALDENEPIVNLSLISKESMENRQ
ncbi:hypothetical protein [Clostridium minihomine]|uniref:hypothetical protein n=1 Tax=Clostridium minihomine TaxID=2045012 RepID=UPI0013EB961E|nr:hypothetical protein [Clostridium minihomine]